MVEQGSGRSHTLWASNGSRKHGLTTYRTIGRVETAEMLLKDTMRWTAVGHDEGRLS